MSIDVEQLSKQVNKILSDYQGATYDAVIEATDKVGEETAKQVVANIQGKIKGTGKYIRSIEYKNMLEKTNYKYVGVVHAKAPHYRLTHLLEYGHLLRDGKRYEGVRHFRPAEEYAENRMLEILPQIIERNTK